MQNTNSIIPMVLERSGNTERSYDLYSRLMRDRIILLQGEVRDEMANIIVGQLLFLESEDPNADITMYVNSPGGSVTAGLAILDTMNFIKPDVATVVLGNACSMGSLLASSGAKGKRSILPSARHMIHSVSSGTKGTVVDMEIDMAESKRLNEYLTNIYVQNTGQTAEKLKHDMSRDYFLDAQKSVDYGLADFIPTGRK